MGLCVEDNLSPYDKFEKILLVQENKRAKFFKAQFDDPNTNQTSTVI